jgi:transposase, IS5 family
MQPRERRETGEQDLFRSRLDQIIDMKHLLVALGRTVDWGFLGRSTPMIRAARRYRRD